MAQQPRPPSKVISSTSQTVQPRIQWKNQVQFRHDLFKLELAKMRKNVSWKRQRPELVDAEHVHFFHSHTSTGTAQKYCVTVGGHFHEVKTSIDQDGNMTATCGPALRKVDKKLSNGTIKTLIEEITYQHEEFGDMGDNHTHNVIYLASEIMSPQKVQQMQNNNANYVNEHVTAAPTETIQEIPQADS